MVYVAYLRAEAARFRKRAKREDQPDAAKEFRELAAVCDRVANEIEDRLPDAARAARREFEPLLERVVASSVGWPLPARPFNRRWASSRPYRATIDGRWAPI